MKKFLIGGGLAASLILAGCATPPPATTASPAATAEGTNTPAAGASDFLACMVSDEGGFDDKSFNETSYKGLKDAVDQLGIKEKDLQSNTVSDFATNIQQMVDSNCNIIVTVGFMLGDDTLAAAKANPDIDFAIVDYAYDTPPENLKGLTFDTAQPAFLAGYVAASLSQTGTVGTFGGLNIPTVTIFMEGFARGVAHYNEVKGTDVKVVGWDSAAKDGAFVGGFSDVAGAKQVALNLTAQGADVLLPVAGPAGEGGLQVAQESSGKISSMWVDSDGYLSMPQYAGVIPTSVGKGMDVAVFNAIKDSLDGNFSSEVFSGTLENEGVYLAPFHDFDSKVSAETKSEVEQMAKDIASGTLKVDA